MNFLSALWAVPLDLAPPTSLPEFWQRAKPQRDAFARPVERALISALHADRLAYAFAAGYQAALTALFPSLGTHELAALCATESAGAHPRDIRTRLEGRLLTGKKVWASGAPFAGQLFVVASIGERDGQNQLRVARVRATARGVTLEPTPDLPFVPELPHAAVQLDGAEADEVLEGDGYARYLKPFRTVEDVHVHAALIGYLVSLARRCGFEAQTKQQLAELATSAVALARHDPTSPGTHVALAGLLASTRRLVDALPLGKLPAAERERWERDVGLLDVAARVRSKRLERAWADLSGGER